MADRRKTEGDVLVAPNELKELLGRLTEYSVEAIPPDEPRTLAGIAAQTGIPINRLRRNLAAIRGRRAWRWPYFAAGAAILALTAYGARLRPAVVATPKDSGIIIPAIPYTESGLVPISKVTFGPDNTSSLVDPSYVPSKELPPGLSVCVETNHLLWGTGDHRSANIQRPLSPANAKQLESTIADLLLYARERAIERKVSAVRSTAPSQMGIAGPSYSFMVSIFMWSGIATEGCQMPAVLGEKQDEVARRMARRAAAKAVETFQGLLKNIYETNQHVAGR